MTLFQCINKLGTFYLIADDFTEAKLLLEAKLAEADYGFASNREVTEIKVISHEVTNSFNGNPNFRADYSRDFRADYSHDVGNALIIKDR